MDFEVFPVIRPIYLCKRVVPVLPNKMNLEGVFTSIHPFSFPHVHPEFCVFAQISSGFANMLFRSDVVCSNENRIIYSTPTRPIQFLDRLKTRMLAHTLQDVRFDQPGLYLVEMFRNNRFMGDTPFHVG